MTQDNMVFGESNYSWACEMNELDIIGRNQEVFTGSLFMMKSKKYPPWQPSGSEGRYSGNGTNAYYFGDSPETCWREIQNSNSNASPCDFSRWAVSINGTFVDVGAVEGTKYVQPKGAGGWAPTQELSNYLCDQRILGFRYASQPAIAGGACGTCFCVYQGCLNLGQEDFYEVQWNPDCNYRE